MLEVKVLPANNPKQEFIKECLFDALMKLMKKNSFDSITVTQLVKTAGVSRMAFYRNYQTTCDIITSYFDDHPFGMDEETDDEIDLKRLMRSMFGFIKDNRILMQNLLSSGMTYLFMNWLEVNFRGKYRYVINQLGFIEEYEVSACIGIYYEIIIDWVKEGMDDESESLAEASLYRILYIFRSCRSRAMSYFVSPQHLGKLNRYDGCGEFGVEATGEFIRIYIQVENNMITSAGAETSGGSVINAAASAACFLALGTTSLGALSFSDQKVSEELDGLPGDFHYCSVLAACAVKNAAMDFFNRQSLSLSVSGEDNVEKQVHKTFCNPAEK
jgi:nitrogen fixation NifU-like protein